MTKHFNPWIHQLGGWLLLALYGGSRKKQVQCLHCDTLFEWRSRRSKIFLMVLIFIVAWILAGFLAAVLS